VRERERESARARARACVEGVAREGGWVSGGCSVCGVSEGGCTHPTDTHRGGILGVDYILPTHVSGGTGAPSVCLTRLF